MTVFTVHGTTRDLVEARFTVHFPAGFTLLSLGGITSMDFEVQVREEVPFRRSAKISADLKDWGAKVVTTAYH